MTQEIAIRHKRTTKDERALKIEDENGEYYEDHKEQKPVDLKMGPELRATSEVATNSARDMVVNTVTDLKYEVETENMITPKNEMENERQSEEHNNDHGTSKPCDLIHPTPSTYIFCKSI